MAGSDSHEDGNNGVHRENTTVENSRLSLSSDEVNYLVFRYLQECGFSHSAFSFAHESMLNATGLRSADRTLPPGALVTFLQKGLQYVGMEERLRAEEIKEAKKDSASTGGKKKESTNSDELLSFSLLSQPAISAITRRDAPLQLNVPPATAVASIKARLEAEAKLLSEKDRNFPKGNHDPVAKLNGSTTTGKTQQQHQTFGSTLDGSSPGTVQQNAKGAAIVPDQQAIASSHALHIQQQQHMATEQVAALDTVGNNISSGASNDPSLDLLAVQQGKHQSAAPAETSNMAEASLTTASRQQAESSSQPQHPAALQLSSQLSSKRATGVGPSAAKRSNKRQKVQKPPNDSRKLTENIATGQEAGSEQRNNHVKRRGSNSSQNIGRTRSPTAEHGPEKSSGHDNLPGSRKPLSHSGGVSSHHDFRPIPNAQESSSGDGPIGNIRVHEKSEEESRLQVHHGVRGGGINGRAIKGSSSEVAGSRAEANDCPPEVETENIEATDSATETPQSHILKLEMHESEVFMCAWNPVYTDLIATGSGDASARIWQVGGPKASAGLMTVKLLPHGLDSRDRTNKDVTTLEWSSDGTLLATGSYDGVARVWARNGALIHTLKGHTGPIFSLKWNKQGNFLLSGSYDKTTIVWDVSGSAGFVEQQFTEHQAPALDVDWKDNITFASCSTDKTVHICRVGVSRPLKVYVGHSDEVNAVKWDPSGRLLASCSDDCTAKIWDVESDRTDPLYDLKSHEQEIYTVKWSPTGPGSRHPSKKPILATASFDGSVRLWNVADGSCYRVFNRHKDSVYSVAFSPSGDYLASGSLAGQMYVWDIEQAKHIKSYKGKGDIFEVAWNKEETRVAACFSSNMVAIIDFDLPHS